MTRTERLPFATLCIIAVNIAAAFALVWDSSLATRFAFHPDAPSIRTAISSMFLHQNVLHLLGNMIFLAAVGPAVEEGAGVAKYLIVYLLGGFAGVIVHWAFSQHVVSPPPLLGASACVSACVAFYALRYFHQKVSIAPKFAVRIYWIVIIWVGLQILGAFDSLGSVQPGMAYWAHLGGFAMGLVLSLVFGAPQKAQLEIARQAIGEMDTRSPAAKLAAAELVLKSHPEDEQALMEKADALATLNEPDKEADCLLRLLDVTSETRHKEFLARLYMINRLEKMASRRRMFLADRYKADSPEVSRLLLVTVIRDMTDPERPDALYQLACLDEKAHPEDIHIWLKDLFTNYPLHPASDLARAKGWAP